MGLSQSGGKARDKDFKKGCLVKGSLGGGVQQRMTRSRGRFKAEEKKKSKKIEIEIPDAG